MRRLQPQHHNSPDLGLQRRLSCCTHRGKLAWAAYTYRGHLAVLGSRGRSTACALTLVACDGTQPAAASACRHQGWHPAEVASLPQTSTSRCHDDMASSHLASCTAWAASAPACNSRGLFLPHRPSTPGLSPGSTPLPTQRHHSSSSLYPAILMISRSFAKKVKIEYVDVPQPKLDPCTLTPTNYLQLLNAIRYAPSLARMAELMQPEMLSRFDAVHVSAALARLPKLIRYREQDMVETHVVAPWGSGIPALRPSPGALPRQANLAQATTLGKTLCAIIPEHSHRMFPRQAANCVWALGTLHKMGVPIVEAGRYKPGRKGASSQPAAAEVEEAEEQLPRSSFPGWQDSLEGLALRIEQAGMSRHFAHAYASLLNVVCGNSFAALRAHGQASEVAQFLKGMALLPRGCQHHPLTHALARFVAERPQQFKAPELRTSAWSIATLSDARGRPGGAAAAGAALQAIAAQAITLHKDFTPAGIASVMWAFAACKQWGPPEAQLVPFAKVKELYAVLAGGIAPQVVLVTPQDIAMIAWACAKHRYRNAALMSVLGDKAVQLLESFKPAELAQTLKAMADLGMPHQQLFESVVKSVMKEPEVSPDLGLDVVSNVMHAYAFGGLTASTPAATAAVQGCQVDQEGRDKARRAALVMLRRLRQPLAASLSLQRVRCGPEEVARLAGALRKLREEEVRCGGLNTEGDVDAELLRALTATSETLVPACTAGQLAFLMTSLEGLPVEGLTLSAAAAVHLKQLIRQRLQQQRAAGRVDKAEAAADGKLLTQHGTRLLQHAVDVLRMCDVHALNDPELPEAVSVLLVAAHGSTKGSHPDLNGFVPLDATRLAQLLSSCRRIIADKRDFREAAAAQLLPLSAAAPAAALTQAFAVYADCAETLQRKRTEIRAAGKPADPQAAATAAATAGRDLQHSLEVLSRLAEPLLAKVPELITEDRTALGVSVAKTLAAGEGLIEGEAAGRLLSLQQALVDKASPA